MFVNLAKDVLMFTDYSHSAAGLVTGERRAVGMTSGMNSLLERLYFGDQSNSPSVEEFMPRESRLRIARLAERYPQMLDELIEETGIFLIDNVSVSLGPITSREFIVDDVVQLNGENMWCPAGTVRSRQVGNYTFVTATSVTDLSSRVTKDTRPRIVVGHSDRLPRLISASPSCGACGACGICSLCGEVNAYAGAVAATALAALY